MHVLSEDESMFQQEIAEQALRAIVSTSGAAYRSQDPCSYLQTAFSTALDATCKASTFHAHDAACSTALDVVRKFDTIQVK